MRISKEVAEKIETEIFLSPFSNDNPVDINKTIRVYIEIVDGLHGKSILRIYKNRKYIDSFFYFSTDECIKKLKAYKVGKGLPVRTYW